MIKMQKNKKQFRPHWEMVKEIALTTHLSIIQGSIASVKDFFEKAYHRRLTQTKHIAQGCVKSNIVNVREYKVIARNNMVRECKVIVRTNIHYNSWLTQSALINGCEASMHIYYVNIEMYKLVHK